MIEIHQVSKSYQDTKVLDNVTANIKNSGVLQSSVQMVQGNQRCCRLLAYYRRITVMSSE